MNNIKKDPLLDLFKQISTEQLPPDFRNKMMAEIMKETVRVKKRNSFWNIVGIALASVCLLVTAGVCFALVNWSFLKEIDFGVDEITWQLPAFSFYTYLIILVGLLLGIDYWFRRQYRKRVNKNTFESR